MSAEFDSLAKILDLANVIIHDTEGKIIIGRQAASASTAGAGRRRSDRSFMSF